MNFKSFNLHPKITANVVKSGYETPTPIQHQAIPKVLQKHDVMGIAQTGTGKTAAFVLPILHQLMGQKKGGIKALIIAPTRELVEQINQAIAQLSAKTHVKSITIYGGVGINPQIKALQHADIVVACPGRLLDHLNRQTADLSRVQTLVLDEADQMFDMGFLPDIRRIVRYMPQKERQTLLFSATMPKEIRHLANEVLCKPVSVEVGNGGPATTIQHALFPVATHQKTALLLRLINQDCTGSVLVFTRTKHRAKNLDAKLSKAGYQSTSLQGNLSQARRQAALKGFKDGRYQIMVATDIAARGIDVSKVSHVINYDIPNTAEAYIHRIGRTGRAQCTGEAFTLVTNEDTAMVKTINRTLGRNVQKRVLEDFNYDATGDPVSNRPSQRSRIARRPRR